jgi:hypothetical protein
MMFEMSYVATCFDHFSASSKVKFTLEQATKVRRGGKMCSSTLSLTSALDGVGGQCHVRSVSHNCDKWLCHWQMVITL